MSERKEHRFGCVGASPTSQRPKDHIFHRHCYGTRCSHRVIHGHQHHFRSALLGDIEITKSHRARDRLTLKMRSIYVPSVGNSSGKYIISAFSSFSGRLRNGTHCRFYARFALHRVRFRKIRTVHCPNCSGRDGWDCRRDPPAYGCHRRSCPGQRNISASIANHTTAVKCSYSVSFVGPDLDCIDISEQTDFSSLLNTPLTSNPAAPFLIWNGTLVDNSYVQVLSRDLVNGVVQANNCTPRFSTYEVNVTLEGNSASARLWSVTRIVEPLATNFFAAYSTLAMAQLQGLVWAGPNGVVDAFIPQGTLQSSGFFVTTSSGNHTWSDNITHVLTSYMHNLSISLLSGDVYYGFSNETATNLISVESTCFSTWNVYIYSSARLLLTYGLAIASSLIVIALGASLILRNGEEGKFMVSHIVELCLNETLLLIRGDINGDTRVRLEQNASHPRRSSLTFQHSLGTSPRHLQSHRLRMNKNIKSIREYVFCCQSTHF